MTSEEATRVESAVPRPMPWLLIWSTCLATFTVTASGAKRTPFLLDMPRDLDTSLTMVANLFGFTSVAWGLASFAAGVGSDMMGRRPFLVGAPLALTGAMVGVAACYSFHSVAAWAILGGGICGLFTGVSMAEVAGRVGERQRGRALGWVMAGQSMTLLVGVPLASWIGASVGWRGVSYCVALMAVFSALAMFSTTATRPQRARLTGAAKKPVLRTALTPSVLRLLSSVIAERICFGLAAIYYATFMLQTYGLSLEVLAIPLIIFAVGNVLGTIVGGQLADRLRNRVLTFAVALTASGIVAILLFGWPVGAPISTALGFGYMFANAIARPSLMAALSNVPSEVRGTVLGLNSTAASAGWLTAAALGGWILSTVGFAGFGPLAGTLALLGAFLAVIGHNKKGVA